VKAFGGFHFHLLSRLRHESVDIIINNGK